MLYFFYFIIFTIFNYLLYTIICYFLKKFFYKSHTHTIFILIFFKVENNINDNKILILLFSSVARIFV